MFNLDLKTIQSTSCLGKASLFCIARFSNKAILSALYVNKHKTIFRVDREVAKRTESASDLFQICSRYMVYNK